VAGGEEGGRTELQTLDLPYGRLATPRERRRDGPSAFDSLGTLCSCMPESSPFFFGCNVGHSVSWFSDTDV
jgi:hypothetical protein